ncbi:MAG: hypothetical protein R6U27_00330, partial [Desulfobacterales bacterium]
EKNGRKSNGRTIKEKNAWLSEHDSFQAELVEVAGKKFEALDAGSVVSVLKRIGYRVLEREDIEVPDAKGPAKHITDCVSVSSSFSEKRKRG